jgi:glycosyltransferase involved in cell wall biosynthesis
MNVTQICIGRFHHFHLARQLERHGMLKFIFTGYPRWKLGDESGIPKDKIRSFPWLQAPYMAKNRLGLTNPRIIREWAWQSHETLDRYAARRLKGTDVLIALSGGGIHAGRAIKKLGGIYICDRGSSHIRFQDEILREEYRRWGLEFSGIDPRVISKEEEEYALADRVMVPSEFVRRSFLERGVATEKIAKIPYGARLDRFRPVAEPNSGKFSILFVGQISLRKGFMDLLDAFERFSHPAKELNVIGAMSDEVAFLLRARKLNSVHLLGNVPNSDLPAYYSRAHVLVLPSIEEGLGMVMGEAMACGCPVIATTNTGAGDLFSSGTEGFVVSIRKPDEIVQNLNILSNEDTRRDFSNACLARVNNIGGWESYGEKTAMLLKSLRCETPG